MLATLNSRLHAPDTAALILRVAMGMLFFAHGWVKLTVFTPAGTAGYFASLGLPGGLAYLTIAAELLGGIALIVGWQVRLVSLALVPVMLGALFFGHAHAGFMFSNEGGGWEYPAFWTVGLLVQAMIGAGKPAIGHD